MSNAPPVNCTILSSLSLSLPLSPSLLWTQVSAWGSLCLWCDLYKGGRSQDGQGEGVRWREFKGFPPLTHSTHTRPHLAAPLLSPPLLEWAPEDYRAERLDWRTTGLGLGGLDWTGLFCVVGDSGLDCSEVFLSVLEFLNGAVKITGARIINNIEVCVFRSESTHWTEANSGMSLSYDTIV